MSKAIMMVLILNLIPLLLSVALARSDQNMAHFRTFKIGENVTYDCISIYNQPGLNHPLLKNHTIQMKSSNSKPESKSQAGNDETYKKNIKCPDGNVPILRNSKEYNTRAHFSAENFVHPLTAENPSAYIAGLKVSIGGPFHGVEAGFDGYTLNIGKDQASLSHMYVASKLNNEFEMIDVGFMTNPSLFCDGRVWTYAHWQGKNGQGCYNNACPGFVQVSQEITVGQPIDLQPGEPALLHISIHQDENTGNWWLTQLNSHKPDVDVGYWPKEIFSLLNNGANIVGVGGIVQASNSSPNPPMGNGKFPEGEHPDSAGFYQMKVVNSKYKKVSIFEFSVEQLLDSSKCYGEKIRRSYPRYEFYYGGPGGDSC